MFFETYLDVFDVPFFDTWLTLQEENYTKIRKNHPGSRYVPSLRINTIKTDSSYIFYISIPGFTKDNVKLHIENDERLTIFTSKKCEEKDEANVLHNEFCTSNLSRSLILPKDADCDRASAICENGILKVEFPFKENLNNIRKIDIQ